jgi:hypothetical protein
MPNLSMGLLLVREFASLRMSLTSLPLVGAKIMARTGIGKVMK